MHVSCVNVTVLLPQRVLDCCECVIDLMCSRDVNMLFVHSVQI